ncbi:MAG: rhodanese-like domain-containing protein [Bacteroidota bacterium]
MMYRLFPFLLLCFFCACGSSAESQSTDDGAAMVEAATPIYQDLTVAEFAERIGGDNTVLLDVRTPGETARGIIDGAIEMDFRAADFAEQLKTLDPSKTYLVYCASGGRSGRTAKMLNELGVQEVYNLAGGYTAWSKQ